MKLKITIFSFLLIALISCDSSSQLQSTKNKILLQGKTMGTLYNIVIVPQKEQLIEEHTIKAKIDNLLKELNQIVSTYIPDSKINQFNQKTRTEWINVDHQLFSIVRSAQDVSNSSKGAFDISISPLIDLWGFGANKKNKIPTSAQIENALTNIGFQYLVINEKNKSLKKTNPNLRIDLSAIAKGYAVDKLSTYLNQSGFTNHLVEIGGELKASGLNPSNKKWRIAVEQPDLSVDITQNGLEITDLAVATSGDYRNYFVENGKRRSHIIDPKTGYPIEHNLASVTVIHQSAMLADAYSTALLVMGEKSGKAFAKNYNLRVLMIIRNKGTFEFWDSSDSHYQ